MPGFEKIIYTDSEELYRQAVEKAAQQDFPQRIVLLGSVREILVEGRNLGKDLEIAFLLTNRGEEPLSPRLF